LNRSDLALALDRLAPGAVGLAIVRDGVVLHESRARGVAGLLAAIDTLGPALAGACAADRVVGRAAALLCVYARLRAVAGAIMSETACETLEGAGIPWQAEQLVPRVLARDGAGPCPLERLVETVPGPEEAYARLKAFRPGSAASGSAQTIEGVRPL
jgi:hypothetical protein